MSIKRRGFLKTLLAGTAATAATTVSAKSNDESQKSKNYLSKKWKQDGITFMEFLLPEHLQANFEDKSLKRKRLISCPMHNLKIAKESDEKWYLEQAKRYIDMGRNGYDAREVKKTDPWSNPHCYIVRVKNHPELFGIFVHNGLLKLNTSAYSFFV